MTGGPTALVTKALHNYFEYKAGLVSRELRQLLQRGRISLLIGVTFLALLLVSADAIGKYAAGTFSSILRESLTIGGWVGMWRPIQIFLYDWWPLTWRQRTYRGLGRAQVRIKFRVTGGGAHDTPPEEHRGPGEHPAVC